MSESPATDDKLVFRWESLDHSLISLHLTELSIEMNDRMKKEDARIRFENRGNLNSMAVPSMILRMQQENADEWARRTYSIYCDVWQKQGHKKSAAFVRIVCGRAIVPGLRARTGAILAYYSRLVTATNLPATVHTATSNAIRLKMQRLEDTWRRRLEIEAKELEHATHRAALERSSHVVDEKTTAEMSGGGSQASIDKIVPNVPGDSSTGLKHSRPGPPARLDQAFVIYAGILWREAFSDGKATVPRDKLREIASSLDHKGYVPPSEYLECKYAKNLKAHNSRNSKSKAGPIKTWGELVSLDDKDFLQGMRRLLSRCAQKSKDDFDHP